MRSTWKVRSSIGGSNVGVLSEAVGANENTGTSVAVVVVDRWNNGSVIADGFLCGLECGQLYPPSPSKARGHAVEEVLFAMERECVCGTRGGRCGERRINTHRCLPIRWAVGVEFKSHPIDTSRT